MYNLPFWIVTYFQNSANEHGTCLQDDDEYIEYRYIESNVTALNDVDVAELNEMTDSLQILTMMTQNGDGSTLEIVSYTNCSAFYCSYIIGADTGILVFDTTAFELFVTEELREHFDSKIVDVDADSGSSVTFAVASYSEEAMTFEVDNVEEEETRDIAYFVLMGVAGIFVVIGIAALMYEKGVITKKRTVDVSRWASFLALGLQFWDFASDISLCFELWFHDKLWNELLILVSAIGSTAFLVIPYLSNLRIASGIKKYVKHNEAASTWYVSFTQKSLHLKILVF